MLVFYFFALIIIFIGWKSLRSGFEYLRFFEEEIRKPVSDHHPLCTIIAPCRGIDEGLEENLKALFGQDYPTYEIVFVTGDEFDDSIPVINSLLSASPRLDGENSISAKLVIAGIAEDEGQKVHNLRQAVLEASPESEIFVFVDSDARPGSKWLKHLVAPLSDDTVGCSSGYRWFLSEKGGFWSELLSVWNASIASALGRNKQENFCWGGSMAIRRSVFESVEMREKWRGTLSDDFTVMRAMREAGLDISFVPQCLTASFHDANFSQMLEFTTRQMKITRVYASEFWKAATIGAMLFSFIFWLGVLLLPFVSGIDLWLLLGFIAITLALGVAKAWIRHRAVRLVLKDHPRELARQFKWQLLLWPLTPLVYLYNGSAALFSNKIIWRGITYELKSPVETVIISRNED